MSNMRIRTAAWVILLASLLFSGCAADTGTGSTVFGTGTDRTAMEPPVLQEGDPAEQAEDENARGQSPDGLLTVTFLDVGQGNAVLVENQGSYMLIDGGDRDYSSYVVSYLQKQGVEELDYVISSHYDADHLNGVIGALSAYPCEMLLAADYTTDTKVYQSLLSTVDEKDILLVHPDMGDTYTFGDAEFTIVSPDAYDYSEDNDNSIGIRLEYGENSFLICGDAGEKAEKMMIQSGLNIESDVYLASHHGSANSSSIAFLEAIRPEAIVISAGKGNSYGHPSSTALENIQSTGAALYRTDMQGTIVVTSDGTNLNFQTPPSTDYRNGEEVESGAEAEPAAGIKDPAGEPQNAAPEPATEPKTTTQPDSVPEPDSQENNVTPETSTAYILNRNTKKFHLPSCSSTNTISEENKAEFAGLREELIDSGYSSCGRCNP